MLKLRLITIIIVKNKKLTSRGNCAVESVSVDENGLAGRLAMSLENIDGLDWHGVTALAVAHLDQMGRIDHHAREELRVAANHLTSHAGLGRLDQKVLVELLDRYAQMLLDVLDGQFACPSVTADDRCRVDLLLDEQIGVLEQLSGDYDHRCGAVTDLLVLQVGQVNQDLGGRVLNLKQLQNGRTVVCDRNVL